MTDAALRSKRCGSTHRIAFEHWHPRETLALDLREDRIAVRQKRHIRNDVAHVAALGDERLAVHAPLEAVVDPVLDDLDASNALPVLGESRIDADPWHRVTPRPVFGVTAHALQPVPHMLRQ